MCDKSGRESNVSKTPKPNKKEKKTKKKERSFLFVLCYLVFGILHVGFGVAVCVTVVNCLEFVTVLANSILVLMFCCTGFFCSMDDRVPSVAVRVHLVKALRGIGI